MNARVSIRTVMLALAFLLPLHRGLCAGLGQEQGHTHAATAKASHGHHHETQPACCDHGEPAQDTENHVCCTQNNPAFVATMGLQLPDLSFILAAQPFALTAENPLTVDHVEWGKSPPLRPSRPARTLFSTRLN